MSIILVVFSTYIIRMLMYAYFKVSPTVILEAKSPNICSLENEKVEKLREDKVVILIFYFKSNLLTKRNSECNESFSMKRNYILFTACRNYL